jgi:F-type H+-transporting ATPase subunit delta
MEDKVVVMRYADAFWQYAQANIAPERIVQELSSWKEIMKDNPDLKEFLESPDFTEREKYGMIDKIVRGNFADEIGQFLKLLINNRRVNHLSNIIEYICKQHGQGDRLSVVLASAFAFDKDLLKRLKEVLEKYLKRPINIFETLDADLLGGFRVTVGHLVFDGSLKRQLADLRDCVLNGRKG